MHSDTKILPIYILAKIYKTHSKSYVAMETTDLSGEAQSPEAPAIILIRKKDIFIYMHIYNLIRNKGKILIKMKHFACNHGGRSPFHLYK